MTWLRERRLLIAVAVAAGALLAVAIWSDDDGGPDGTPLAADVAPDPTRPASTSSSTTVPPPPPTEPPPSTTTASASPAAAGPSPAPPSSSSTTPPPPTSTTVPPTTTSTTVPSYSAEHCPRPGPSSDFAAFDADVIAIRDERGVHRSCMLVADTAERRRQGLMGQDDLDGYAGMAFIFEDEQERSFWMHDTRIPLSIAFFDARGSFVSAADMEPCDDGIDCPTYSSEGPSQFAVEVPRGRLASVGATPGSAFEG